MITLEIEDSISHSVLKGFIPKLLGRLGVCYIARTGIRILFIWVVL